MHIKISQCGYINWTLPRKEKIQKANFVVPFCRSPTFSELKNALSSFLLYDLQNGLFYAYLLPKSSDWRRDSLAFAILQVEMRIEVDEDPLVGTRRRYHPCASLRRGIRHGVSWRGEVAGRRDSDVASTFICRTSDNSNRDGYTWCTIHKVNIIAIASILQNL